MYLEFTLLYYEIIESLWMATSILANTLKTETAYPSKMLVTTYHTLT
jgi:hypothetical protein